MRWQPFDRERPGLTLDDGARTEVLATGLRSLAFKYFGHDRRGTPSGWLSAWNDTNQLPQLVDITVDFVDSAEETWPTFVAAVMTESVER
jgi:hypothetical protein